MRGFSSGDARMLLHNKFVVILGDSIQRSVYKDLVLLLQGDKYLTEAQLKKKGEMTFQNDTLVEGGSLNEMHNRVTYREVRQYRTGNHLVRFYFLTRVYSKYLESVLSDFTSGPQPDVVLLNSCIWDLLRYDDYQLQTYRSNLDTLFCRLTEVLSPDCLVIWNTTMPVGFKEGEVPQYTKHNLRWDIIEGNFYSSTLANIHKMDIVDMHYHFRFDLLSRCKDATHWNQLAHRKYTQILLTHIAQAWGVKCSNHRKVDNPKLKSVHPVALKNNPHNLPPAIAQERGQCHFVPIYVRGYTAFDGTDRNTPCGAFDPGARNFHGNFIYSDAASPFVNDSPLLHSGLASSFVPFDRHVKRTAANIPGPVFNNPLFAGMTIPPHLPVPAMEFGTFHYENPIVPEGWNGHPRFTKRRFNRPTEGWMHPYFRPPLFPTRN